MNPRCTAFGAVPTAVLLALAPGAAAVADDPSPLPTRAHATISAEQQINLGAAAQPATVGWMFWDGGAQVPVPTHDTVVIDARDLAGVAGVEVDDPRCKADGQVFTCVNKDASQSRDVELTLRADAGAAPGDGGTITYTLTADDATGATAKTNVVVGTRDLVVGRLPEVTDAGIGSRIDLPLRLRNTGDLATDRRIMLRWESVGGLVFDRKFSNCAYGEGDDPIEPGSQTSVTCIFPAPVPAGAVVELSSPLTATVGKRVLTAVVDYSVKLLNQGEQPGGGSHQGTGQALTLVEVSGAGGGFENGAEGGITVSADNSADLAADAKAVPGRRADEWTLDISAVNHGPASAYGIDRRSIALVEVVLPKDAVVTGTADMEQEDDPYGPCLLWVSGTETAPFEAGHRHYVCTVPFGVAAGKSQLFELSVRTGKGYEGAKGTATVRPGPAGFPLHDPDASNDSVTFAFGTSATPSGDTPSTRGAGRTALVATATTGVLLGAVVLVVRRRKRSR
ncbi:hypothetical protein [Streptomyces sp. GESEQ-35]|uniref:hypothetical protein n=1 Tax=Streptomyces sp. GESEQ-35 TaxID=2812657 RepID=UPI001B32A5E6|nr:hypothetical protein [Streptomyces sp. GESEQ-35]